MKMLDSFQDDGANEIYNQNPYQDKQPEFVVQEKFPTETKRTFKHSSRKTLF
jgi:hypothetical protein